MTTAWLLFRVGILRLGKQYGNDRLEAACQRACTAPVVNYGMIANILKCNLDKVPLTEPISPVPRHEQIRELTGINNSITKNFSKP